MNTGKTKENGNKALPAASVAPLPVASSKGAGASRGANTSRPLAPEAQNEELYEDAALEDEGRGNNVENTEGTAIFHIEILVLKITRSLQTTAASPDEAVEGVLVNLTGTEARKHEAWREATEDRKLDSDENLWMLPTTQIRQDQDMMQTQ